MSLPLTYDDGINLLPKRCEDDEAHFACEVPRKSFWFSCYVPIIVFLIVFWVNFSAAIKSKRV